MEFKNEAKLKEEGKINLEGKNHIVKDGDVIFLSSTFSLVLGYLKSYLIFLK